MDNRGHFRSRSPLWGARFVQRYEYLLIYISFVVTVTLIVALLGR